MPVPTRPLLGSAAAEFGNEELGGDFPDDIPVDGTAGTPSPSLQNPLLNNNLNGGNKGSVVPVGRPDLPTPGRNPLLDSSFRPVSRPPLNEGAGFTSSTDENGLDGGIDVLGPSRPSSGSVRPGSSRPSPFLPPPSPPLQSSGIPSIFVPQLPGEGAAGGKSLRPSVPEAGAGIN